MSAGWNFERRRDTCAQFLVGVSRVTGGVAERATNLEAVRSRTRQSPEEALFAARRLAEESLLHFEPGGSIRSTAAGIARAAATVDAVLTKARRVADVRKLLAAGGPPLALLVSVLRELEGELACEPSDDELGGTYRLVCAADEVSLQRADEPPQDHNA